MKQEPYEPPLDRAQRAHKALQELAQAATSALQSFEAEGLPTYDQLLRARNRVTFLFDTFFPK